MPGTRGARNGDPSPWWTPELSQPIRAVLTLGIETVVRGVTDTAINQVRDTATQGRDRTGCRWALASFVAGVFVIVLAAVMRTWPFQEWALVGPQREFWFARGALLPGVAAVLALACGVVAVAIRGCRSLMAHR